MCATSGADPGGGGGGGGGGLSSSDHTPYLHVYPTYSGISNKEVERKLSAGLFPTETACDSQIQSQLVLGTKTVLSSDHVHGESSSDLTLVIHD